MNILIGIEPLQIFFFQNETYDYFSYTLMLY